MIEVFIGIGSNLGNRQKNIDQAIEKIEKLKKVFLEKKSTSIQTKPQRAVGPDYLNKVIKIKTNLEPEKLLTALQKIENSLGRKRTFKNSPRTIDLDILLYGRKKIKTRNLTVPHPEIMDRDFVKKPLLEIEPELEIFLNEHYNQH